MNANNKKQLKIVYKFNYVSTDFICNNKNKIAIQQSLIVWYFNLKIAILFYIRWCNYFTIVSDL